MVQNSVEDGEAAKERDPIVRSSSGLCFDGQRWGGRGEGGNGSELMLFLVVSGIANWDGDFRLRKSVKSVDMLD